MSVFKKQNQKTHWFASLMLWLDARPVRLCLFLSLILTFVAETLSQRSLIHALIRLITQPYFFIINALLAFLLLSLSLLTRKRYFSLTFISLLLLGLSVANFVLQSYRITPLAAIDFAILPSVFSILGHYLSIWQLIIIGILFLIAIALLVLLAIRTPKQKADFRLAFGAILGSAAVCAGLIVLGLYSKTLPARLNPLGEAYREYGFFYCFSSSIFDRGITKPDTYDNEIDELYTQLSQQSTPLPESPDSDGVPPPAPIEDNAVQEKTNVIFLQLESFIDPNLIRGYQYSENPCPTFSHLKATCPSGYLTVPSIGAGTANTEFEILSGMSLQFFGTGEYPYKTVLRNNTCETICYNLAEHGYVSTAIHNNKATFYDRDEVFSNLGFQNFISLEYMNNVHYNPQGWACDEVLVRQILETLQSTEEPDLIYTISVQGHGRYPDMLPEDYDARIQVSGEEDEVISSRVTYYVNQVAEMDQFLADLTEALSDYPEPVMLVFYGDHMPSLDFSDEQLACDSFQTEYVIWRNKPVRFSNRDLCAFQLSAYIMQLLGYENGFLTTLHQSESMLSDYMEKLELLEYDMLYGDKTVYGGTVPFVPTDLHMGIHEIKINSLGWNHENLYVFGEHFTPFSVVCINGRQQKTSFVTKFSLRVDSPDIAFENIRSISVEQVSEDQKVLSETGQFIIK